jgi:hypothetical protein
VREMENGAVKVKVKVDTGCETGIMVVFSV